MVVGLLKVLPPDGVCRGCIFGKHHQAPFDSGLASRAQNQIKLVHSDLCCMNKLSLVGAWHILIFIDNLSRFTWVYFLKNKNLIF